MGAAFWLICVKPLRLRAAAVLLVGGTGGMVAAAWAFAQGPLSDDRVPLGLREQAGLQLLVLVVVLLGVMAFAGMAVGFVAAARPPSRRTRDRIGVVLLCGLALVPVGVVAKMALSDEGLGGAVSRHYKSLTDPNAAVPINDPSRLTASGSVRARYWDEALRIFRDNPAKGVGAGGYATVRKRYRTADGAVRTAHGYVVQTLADLGIAGAGREPRAARGVARERRRGDRAAPARARDLLLARAHRPVDARRDRARLRRALARRLDVVRAGQCRRRAAGGRLGRRARAAVRRGAATRARQRSASACAPGCVSARAPSAPA